MQDRAQLKDQTQLRDHTQYQNQAKLQDSQSEQYRHYSLQKFQLQPFDSHGDGPYVYQLNSPMLYPPMEVC